MQTNRTNVIEIKGVRYCYGDVCALQDVGFGLPPRRLTALIGPNGGGKSTLIKLIAGLIKPGSGMILREKNVTVGYVPQGLDFDTSFPLTVLDLVQMGTLENKIRPFFRYNMVLRQQALSAIERVGLLGFESRGISQLSGGQLKRAVIARALASNASVIALDEPDASLDIDAARDLYAMLQTLKPDKTIVIASHHIDAVLSIADQALFVRQSVSIYPDPKELNELVKGGLML